MRALVQGMTAMGLVLGAYATLVEPRWLEITRREIFLPRLPAAWDGLRLAHLSDFHLSRLVPAAYLERCIQAAMALEPELVLLTGDFVTRSRGWVARLPPLLCRLRAPLGVWGVLGNHDHSVTADGVAAAVARAGVTMLRNRRAPLERDGAALWLAGIDSMSGSQYGLSRRQQERVDRRMRAHLHAALDGLDPDAFCLLLAHSPDILPMAATASVDLILAGHTHGGQVRFPVVGATVVPSRYGARYAAGLFTEGDTRLYVTRGLGVVRLPVRFLCRPELSLLTLRQAEYFRTRCA